MPRFNASEINRRLREAQRRAQQEMKREIDRVNRANKQAVDSYNRKVDAHNRKIVSDYNRRAAAHNRQVESRNKSLLASINRQLRSPSSSIRYSESELALADRLQRAVPPIDSREYDAFLSYARIDGAVIAADLRSHLEKLGAAVWFDEVAIQPGRSQSLQMDAGLRKARSGIAVLTPAYLTGRFWTERELGVLLNKEVLIPVLHKVSFEDVRQYSGILPDLAGFTTEKDSVEEIAQKIAAAVLGADDEA